MSAPRLSVFFSGTDMTWEDMAVYLQLGMKNRHNLHEQEAKHYYYTFDGPAAAVSDQHKPVENLKFNKDQKDDFMSSSARVANNAVGYRYRWALGKGTNHIANAGYQLILNRILTKGIREIDLIGFSRGGSITLLVGALLKKLERDLKGKLSPAEMNAIKVNIYAIDPVAGKTRNIKASRYGRLSRFVDKCVVGLATNESLAGFHPRDILSDTSRYNVQFSDATKYVFLPFPEDHAMAVQWMRDIVKSILPENSELHLPCDDKRLIFRRLQWAEEKEKPEVKWSDRIDETRAYRLAHLVKHKELYVRHIFHPDEKQRVETMFQFLGTQRSHYNVGHTSFQNDADTESKDRKFEGCEIGGLHPKTKSAQQSLARKNNKKKYKKVIQDRACKVKLSQYTNMLFINSLHEAIFAKNYPQLHQFLLNWNVKDLDAAMAEFDAIPAEKYPFTKLYIENALIEKMTLHPVSHFKSTNVRSLGELLDLVNYPTASSVKDEDKKEVASEQKSAITSMSKEVKATDSKTKSCLNEFLRLKFFKQAQELTADLPPVRWHLPKVPG
ncbi:MAG: hypothetical protein ACYCQI_03140 [Gammaproteobacteria bacterium]